MSFYINGNVLCKIKLNIDENSISTEMFFFAKKIVAVLGYVLF